MTVKFIKADTRKPTTLTCLSEIIQQSIKELSQIRSQSEICDFLSVFGTEASLKERIQEGEAIFFIIQNESKNIGYIELKDNNSEILVQNFHILKQYRNLEIYRQAFNNLLKIKNKIRLSIFQIFDHDLKNLKKIGFENVCFEVTYIGSDIYLNKEILEYKKNPL